MHCLPHSSMETGRLTESCTLHSGLPYFWTDRPVLWFVQAKTQIDLAGITRQTTTFNYLVSQLHQQRAANVEDIMSPLEDEPYDCLKPELARRFSTFANSESENSSPTRNGRPETILLHQTTEGSRAGCSG